MAPKIKPDPGKLYVAATSYIGPAGPVRAGDRLRGDSEVVRATPGYWIEDGTPDDEALAIMRRRFPDADPFAFARR